MSLTPTNKNNRKSKKKKKSNKTSLNVGITSQQKLCGGLYSTIGPGQPMGPGPSNGQGGCK